jgi:hypothetical protein
MRDVRSLINSRSTLYRRCIGADYVRLVLPFTVAIATALGCVFAASSASKLRHRRAWTDFRASMRATRLLPERAVATVAAALATGEAVVALALLGCAAYLGTRGVAAPVRAVTAVVLAAALLLAAVLAAGVALVVRRGTVAACACFGGTAQRPLSRVHLWRNGVIMLLAATGVAVTAPAPTPASAAMTLLAAATGAIGSLFIVFWDDLAELWP